jgi:23S rRNA (uridine2552-2'-O)-methyltransferase
MYKPKDTYFHKAKREGYPARSVYKLQEIDERYKIIKKGARILELGASPGSWIKYCLKKIGKGGYILAIDLEEPSLTLPPQADFIKGDIFKINPESLRGALARRQFDSFDLILSDLAPRTSGIRDVDQARSMELARRAIATGKEVLRKGGNILVKIFESNELPDLRKQLSSIFSRVILERPKAVRKGSSEIYLLGLGFLP